MTQMAISSHLGWLIVLIGAYPFLLVGCCLFFYDEQRKHIIFWVSVVSFVLAAYFMYMHMQIEIVFGWELLEAWYREHPEDRPK